jgi:hypothetical protein
MASNAKRAATLVRALEAISVSSASSSPPSSTTAPARCPTRSTECSDDRIASFREYWNEGELMAQLPLPPAR